MFVRRRREREPTRWYRLADSDELFTALHEAPNDHPLLPGSGQRQASPLRKFVAMELPEAPVGWSSQGAWTRAHPRQLTTSWASFSPAETMMRPLAAPNRYDEDQNNGLRLKHMQQQPQQPLMPLQHLLPPQRRPVYQQQPQLLKALPQPSEPPDPRLHQQQIPPVWGTQLAEHGGSRSPVLQVPSGSLPWQARAQSLAPEPQMAGTVLHGDGFSRGPMSAGPAHRSPTVTAGYPTAAVQPLHGLTPAAAVAAVAAIDMSGGRNGVTQGLQTMVTYSGSATLQTARDIPVQLMGPYFVHQHWQAPAYQQAAGSQGPVGCWDPPPLDLGRTPLMQPPQVGPSSAALHPGNFSGLGPPDMSSISSIQQWLLLVPDHSKMALEKAWFMSAQRATKAALGPTQGGTGRLPTSGGNRHMDSALGDVPVGGRPLQLKVPAVSQAELKSPTPKQPGKVPVKAQDIYQPDGTALTPELVLHYTNMLYGEDWDKQSPWPAVTTVVPNTGTRVAGSYIGYTSAQRTADTNQSAVTSAGGTKRLYKMYNQLIGRVTATPKLVDTAISPAPGRHSPELPQVEMKQDAQPLACLPYMPELMEHITKASLSSRDAPPSPRAIQYIPKTAVWQAAWAAHRAATTIAAVATAQDFQAASASILATERGVVGHTSSSNTLYAYKEATTSFAALGRDGAGAIACDGPIPGQHHQVKRGASRWRDRQHMESVLAPVYMVDLDNGEVTISYVHGHGRSEVETQTDRCILKDGQTMESGGSSSDAASYSTHSSAIGSGTDMTGESSSSALTCDDTEDSESTSGNIDQHSTRAVTTGRIVQLLKSMNIFGRWRRRGESKRQGQAVVSGDKIPAGVSTGMITHSEGDDVGSNRSNAPTALVAVGGKGTPPDGDNKANTTNGVAVDDMQRRKRRKTEGPQASSGTNSADATSVMGSSSIDHQQQVDSSHKQRTKEKNKVRKVQKKHTKTDAGLNGSASTAGDGAKMSSKDKKPKFKTDTKPLVGPTAPDIAASNFTIGDQQEDTKSKMQLSTTISNTSVAATTDATSTAVRTAINNDGTIPQENTEKGGASSEVAVGDCRSESTTDNQSGGLIPQAGIRSKIHHVVRHFKLHRWKRSGVSQPQKAVDDGILATHTESAVSDEVDGDQRPAVEQQESPKEVADGSPVSAASGSKAGWKGFHFWKLRKIQLIKRGDSARPKMADNTDVQVSNEVKDNTAGDNIAAETNNDDGLPASGQAASSSVNNPGSIHSSDGASRTVHTPAVAGNGNKTWLQKLFSSVNTSVLGRFPGAKQQPGSSLPNAEPADGKVHNKEMGRQKAESMQQSPGDAAMSRGCHVEDLAEVENQEANSDLEYMETSRRSVPSDAGKAKPKKVGDDKSGDNNSRELKMETISKVKAKLKAATGGLFARILGLRHHGGSANISQQIPITTNLNANTGVIDGGSSGSRGIAAGLATIAGQEQRETADNEGFIGAQTATGDAADDKKLTDTEETASDEDVWSQPLPPATETKAAGATFETAGPPMSEVTAGSLVSTAVMPPAIESAVTEPELQDLKHAASNQIEAMASEGLQTSAQVATKVVRDGKGKQETKKVARKAAAGKKLLSPTAATPSIVLPPPQGPKAKLMQKLLRLSDAVNAQRAAAAASSLGDDVVSSRGLASDTTAAAGDDAADQAAGRKNDSMQVDNAINDTSQNLPKRDEPNQGGGLQQRVVQQLVEATAVPIDVSVQNKSKALERLKNTLARTRGRQAPAASELKTTISSRSECADDTGQGIINNGHYAQNLEQDSSVMSHVAPQVPQQEQAMWGTRSQRGNPASPDNETDASSKPGGKATMMERMMASLRRPKHQAEVQEMVVFTDGQDQKSFGAAEITTAKTASGAAHALVADETTAVTAMRSSVTPSTITESSIPAAVQSQPAAARGASSPVSGAGSLTTTSRLNSTTRSDLGASSPFGRQVHQAENLMASIRKLQQMANNDHETNLNNTNGRRVGSTNGSPAVTSGGWTVQ
ncbi:hypothetical protein Vretimale_8183 [Volvox reticuliferus]|uniref:Uncharacterized protein n=1 Tax=Volvox reticuliferus TaxID=1737510 RepID=A0A8J4GB17_9CHLO|nr:hypothetical protein Vretimale_8183 [Volvox reticuliferus]